MTKFLVQKNLHMFEKKVPGDGDADRNKNL